MTTAPNSLMPLANIITKPVVILRHASGSDIVKKTLVWLAPRLRAAFSSLSGTAAKPSRAAFIRNGRLTKAMASAIPEGWLTRLSPNKEATFPRKPSREIKPSKAIPAAVCGSTMGRSIIPCTRFLTGNFLRASSHANGIAPIAKIKVAVKETHRVSQTL